jgi:deoxyribodipyrimidine photo-lyase
LAANDRVDPDRLTVLRDDQPRDGPVLYWMRRDRRKRDNWALLYAQDRALARGVSLGVVTCMPAERPAAVTRNDRFMFAGLAELAEDLAALRIPFFLIRGDPVRRIPALVDRCKISCLVTDFDPLRMNREQEFAVCRRIPVPCVQVDAHNVVPVRRASSKQEYAARTLRPKIQRLLPRFLTDLPPIRTHPHPWPQTCQPGAVQDATPLLDVSPDDSGVRWCAPGEASAHAALERFLDDRLATYDAARNDPTLPGQSDLSPYFHFGQLSPQRAAFAAAQRPEAPGREAFLEELIVRRELSDNFCYYNDDYDRYEGFPEWGRRTLEDHLDDPREYLYELAEFEAAATHEPLWNAAQTELMVRGKMHGYMRMYWAKKILEWTRDPASALQIAITLNDRYSLDGTDANGYAGCAWSIGGLHDRPWFERPVFGKIRFMNLAGCKRKFRVPHYIERVNQSAVGDRSARS